MKERRFHGPGLSPGMLPAGKRWYAEDQSDRKMIRVLDQWPEKEVENEPCRCGSSLKNDRAVSS